jgi:hypothetical protein
VFAGAKVNHNALWSLVEEARKQLHGTMLVMSAEAAVEAERLASEATAIEPVALDAEMMKSATRIDGSVLVDLNGVIHPPSASRLHL